MAPLVMRKGIVAKVASLFMSPIKMKIKVNPDMVKRALTGTLFGPFCKNSRIMPKDLMIGRIF